MSMTATFYNNASAPEVVNKQLTTLGTANIDITNGFVIDKPNFQMARNDSLLTANYMYVPDLNRYYFVTLEVENGAFIRIVAESDPLKSFWNSIKTSQCIAYRSASKPDVRIEDEKVFKKPKPTIIFRKLGQPFQLSSSYNYVLTVTGKGSNASGGGE